ncbi:MAG TPA: mechanosensitive ion channel [Candidatus Absconditabacterales bacterium]|nr:mechanosensitive ion channel [Candidatus Absconditabacterales bacterium]
MNALGAAAGAVQETFREFLIRMYENPFVSKIIAIILAIILSFVLLSASKVLASYIKNKITKNFVLKGNKDVENVSALLGDVIFYTLAMFSLFISFSIVGIQVGLILGGISIGVGFAFRQTLTNLISGIMIYTTKEYQPGSIVSVKLSGGEVTGKIESIDMKNIVMRSFDFKRVVIPNSQFVRSVIRTYSLESVLKLDIELNVDINLDIEKVIESTLNKTNSYDFVIYKEYTQVLIQSFDQKICKFKVSFCFNPNAGIPTDVMKSRVQAGLIQEYKTMATPKE